MHLKLAGRKAVITGATKGIGRAVAETLAVEGCILHLVARSEADLTELASELKQSGAGNVTIHALDLARSEDQQTLAGRCAQADILVNSAGDIPSGELDALSEEQWRAGWELKVFGYINLCREFYTAMKARGDGVIINIIGAAGVRPDAGYIAGTTGNAALIAFTKALGSRSVDFGVRVVGINPSLTDTPRAQRILAFKASRNSDNPNYVNEFIAGLPLGRMCAAQEIADMAAFLASERAGYMSGTVVDVDGGTSARS